MGKIVVSNQPCLNPSCGSHDARQIYENGTSFCFSCRTTFRGDSDEFDAAKTAEETRDKETRAKRLSMKTSEILEFPIRGLKSRRISKQVAEFFGVRSSNDGDGVVDAHYYPYGDAFKIRKLPKEFSWAGQSDDLFGADKFNSGGKRVIITEGEIDALTVAQASFEKYNGKIYPVVALSSAAMAKKSLLKRREWLRSFEEIVLWFDQDEAGQVAVSEALKILGGDKVKIVKTPYKDASECYEKVNENANQLMIYVFDAAPYIPSGMITKEEIWAKIVEQQNQVSIPYPPCSDGLNEYLKGIRGGEISLFISGTGSGKSTLMKEIVLHLVYFQPELEALIAAKNLEIEEENALLGDNEQQKLLEPYKIKVGIISLEEPPAKTGSILAAMALKRNGSNDRIPLRDLKVGFDMVFNDDNLQLLDHQGSMNDASIIEKLEYLILNGCTHLIIDHITILVSEGAGGLTGNEAQDKVMNDLLKLVTRYPHVWIGLVSHLRKTNTGGTAFEQGEMPGMDDIKGSGSIKQISFDIIAFSRDMSSANEEIRNSIMMSVLKCRYTGLTGPVKGSRYNHDTGRLEFLDSYPEEAFEEEEMVNITPKEPRKVMVALPQHEKSVGF